MNYEKICNNVISAAATVGEFILGEAVKFSLDSIETKGINDFVSYVDKNSEKILVEALRKILPEGGFLAEEGTVKYNGENLKWIIDPLDGTTNFIHGIPVYSISIALMEGNETLLGVVYEPNFKECFYAWKNSPAFLNGHLIHVSKASSVKESLIATGFPYNDYNLLPQYLAAFEYLLKNSHGARRIGSAAVDLAYVACGRFEAFYEYNLKPWDVAAGAFIVKQAGGMVTDFSNGNNYIFGKELIATNNLIQNEFFEIIRKYMLR
jgi:myo-inositol-1(or 4)-monophosphatase